MTGTTLPFTIDGYCATVQAIMDRGYKLSSFHDAVPDAPHLILRHDIDQSIQVARQLAEIEAAAGWRSTWFVLMRTEMYNPWSAGAVRDLRRICALGHEVGLHLDATLYPVEQLETGAATECRALEDILGQPVRALSFHRPTPDGIGGVERLAGRLNVYAARFTRDIGYCSDSRGGWHHGHPWQHPALRLKHALQLLTHAIWWVGPEGRSAAERLADFLEVRHQVLDDDLARNNKVWDGRSR